MIKTMMKKTKIIEFIKRRFPIDCNWTNGNCYYFALILQSRFGGEIYYDVIQGHFVTKINNEFYDYTGKINFKNRTLINWNNFDDYDHLQKNRIIRDCIK